MVVGVPHLGTRVLPRQLPLAALTLTIVSHAARGPPAATHGVVLARGASAAPPTGRVTATTAMSPTICAMAWTPTYPAPVEPPGGGVHYLATSSHSC